jgi:hypothetical protein
MEIKINLIPPYIKREIDKLRQLNIVLNLGLEMLMIVIIFFSFLFGVYYVLEVKLSIALETEKRDSNLSRYKRIRELDGEFEGVNLQMKNIMLVKKDQLYWSDILYRLSNASAEGISIDSLANKNYQVMLSGKAKDRDSLIVYREKLEKDGCFSEINLPLSNLVSRTDIVFQIDFKVKEECLKRE